MYSGLYFILYHGKNNEVICQVLRTSEPPLPLSLIKSGFSFEASLDFLLFNHQHLGLVSIAHQSKPLGAFTEPAARPVRKKLRSGPWIRQGSGSCMVRKPSFIFPSNLPNAPYPWLNRTSLHDQGCFLHYRLS